MTYSVPAHGEPNWDGKISPSLQYLKDTAEAAETPTGSQAKATAAQNAAIAAAATDATNKANTAQANAIASAATDATTKANSVQTSLNTHVGNVANPHSVTKAQVGLGNVDNTSDVSKPVSTAQQAALDAKQNTASLDSDLATKIGDSSSSTRSALGTYGADGHALRRLADASAADRTKSNAVLRTARDDSSKIVEQWASLSAWAPSTNAQVSGGFLYGTSGSPNPAGGTQAFVVPKNTPFRVVGTINLVAGGSELVMFGLCAAAGAATAGAGHSVMWGFNSQKAYRYANSGDFGVVSGYMNDTTGTQQGVVQTSETTWILTIWADETNIFVSLGNKINRNREFIDTIPWSSLTGTGVQTLIFWNSDARLLTGSSIGPLGGITSLNTVAPRTNIEGNGYSIFEGTSAASNLFRVYTPASYDSRNPTPVVIYHHGAGGDARALWRDANMQGMTKAFLDAGYIVAASYNAGNNWGNQASIDANHDLYVYLRDHFSIGPVMHWAESMGGLSSLLTLADRRVPAAAWLGLYPVTNLSNMYGGGSGTYAPQINAAYGIPGSGTYAAQTAGHDPQLMEGRAFRGIPMRFYSSSGDTVVSKTQNTDLFAAKCSSYAPECVVVATTGDHGDASNFVPSEAVAFFNRYKTL